MITALPRASRCGVGCRHHPTLASHDLRRQYWNMDNSSGVGVLDKAALVARLSEYSFYPEIAGELERVEATGVGALLRKVEKVHLTEASRYSHLHALSILPILDYIVRKDREAQNIRLIARGKESRLSTDVIRELLVV